MGACRSRQRSFSTSSRPTTPPFGLLKSLRTFSRSACCSPLHAVVHSSRGSCSQFSPRLGSAWGSYITSSTLRKSTRWHRRSELLSSCRVCCLRLLLRRGIRRHSRIGFADDSGGLPDLVFSGGLPVAGLSRRPWRYAGSNARGGAVPDHHLHVCDAHAHAPDTVVARCDSDDVGRSWHSRCDWVRCSRRLRSTGGGRCCLAHMAAPSAHVCAALTWQDGA